MEKQSGSNIYIRPLTGEDSEPLLDLENRNKDFFERFSMSRSDEFYTLDYQQHRIKEFQQRQKNDTGYDFGIFTKEGKLIGTISLFHVMRGSLQSAFIGYFLDKEQNGKGFTTEAVKLIVEFAFHEVNLHRIEAGVMPHNAGSIRVLEKAGFHIEGMALKNVKINGQWEDHQVLALINPNDE
ncbi:GNAT family N-acetyltransferase [Fictibacillus fluitans]|uniref:GNAT family protein n=1 Tax=Fictibacillus fluitans TaxID=3058422 RepID=A0ABT8HQ51_9BACL|nr:GNAT family protein [Fictibacillus sp. NE201]MDN4522892.1 GNAT family protein [Fictibacillus sp. NE201]